MTGEETERAAFSGEGVLYEFGEARALHPSRSCAGLAMTLLQRWGTASEVTASAWLMLHAAAESAWCTSFACQRCPCVGDALC